MSRGTFESILSKISETLANEESVKISSFGSFLFAVRSTNWPKSKNRRRSAHSAQKSVGVPPVAGFESPD